MYGYYVEERISIDSSGETEREPTTPSSRAAPFDDNYWQKSTFESRYTVDSTAFKAGAGSLDSRGGLMIGGGLGASIRWPPYGDFRRVARVLFNWKQY